jgi:hypothetical protein
VETVEDAGSQRNDASPEAPAAERRGSQGSSRNNHPVAPFFFSVVEGGVNIF